MGTSLCRTTTFKKLTNLVGHLAALATTCWRSDLLAYAEEIYMSDAMILDGKSLVGIYTHPNNQHALTCKSLADFIQLRFVSNRDWSADWNTLKQLGIQHCVDVKTWRQMVSLRDAMGGRLSGRRSTARRAGIHARARPRCG